MAETNHVFDFFGLARELRDMVYDELLIDNIDPDPCENFQATVTACAVPLPSLLLVSRQFTTELQNRATRSSTLNIEERLDPEKLPEITIDGSVTNIPHLELRLYLACNEENHEESEGACGIKRDIQMHEKWIKFLIQQMKHLHSLSIELYLSPHEYVDECQKKLLTHQSRFTALPCLTTCNVYHSDGLRDCQWDYGEPKQLVMVWSNETGTIQSVEPEQLAKAHEE